MKGKHEGNYNPYLEQRDREFMKAYRNAVKELLKVKGSFSLYEALNIARNTETSRFFVSEQRVSEIIKSIDNYVKAVDKARNNPSCQEIPVDPMRSFIYQRRRMYTHLFIIYNKLKEQNPDIPHEELVVMTCATPAEEFYMTIESARAIHGRITKNMKDFGILSSRSRHRILRDLKKRNK